MIWAPTEMADAPYLTPTTSVWWDIDNCRLPHSLDANQVAYNICSALVKINYFGPVSIFAYGDINRIPFSLQRSLSSTGIVLCHVPSGGGKAASEKNIALEMLLWAVDNPPPASLLLISPDGHFSNVLHQLRMRRYNILLAHPHLPSPDLAAAATTVWLWSSLAAGGSPLPLPLPLSPPNPSLYSLPQLDLDCEDAWIGGSESSRDCTRGETRRVRPLCNVVYHSLETFAAHTSSQRHASQAKTTWLIEQRRALVGPFTALHRAGGIEGGPSQPIKRPKAVVKAVWCGICGISCNSKTVYADHIFGQRHQSNLELLSGKPRERSMGMGITTTQQHQHQHHHNKKKEEEDVEMKKKKVIAGGAEANAVRVCEMCGVVCNSSIVFRSHLRGLRHAAMLRTTHPIPPPSL